MLNITNDTNLKLIKPYINQQNVQKIIEGEVNMTSVLGSLHSSIADEICLNNLCTSEVFIRFMTGKNNSVDVGTGKVNAVVHEYLHKTLTKKKNKNIEIDTTALAELIRQLFKVIVIKETRDLYLYNFESGIWQCIEYVLDRFIYEVVSTTLEMEWSSVLTTKTLQEVDKKPKIIPIAQLNLKGFAFRNGTLDYQTNKIVPHNPEHYCTIHSDVKYEPTAICPKFMVTLDIWFKGEEDTKNFIQEWFGYSLCGSFKANAFLMVYSKGGEGKSTLFGVLEKLVGHLNVTSTPLSNFNSTFGLEPLVGKKLNISTESNTDSFDTAKLKAITAGEKITVNRKNLAETEMKLPIKMMYLLNNLPEISDSSTGFKRRLLILPLLNKLNSTQQDKNLPQKLEEELSGILNWAMEGLERLENNNYKFTISKSMMQILNKYLTPEEVMEKFVIANIIEDSVATTPCKEVISAYEIWCDNNGFPITNTNSPKIFWKLFKTVALKIGLPFTKYKTNGGQALRGLKLI